MSSVVKLFVVLYLLLSSTLVAAKDIYILVIGEGVAANCNEHVFSAIPGVFEIGLDGIAKPARDPFAWSECSGGSIWIPLGAELIATGRADKVFIMPLGVERAKAKDWLAGGIRFAKLTSAIQVANRKGIKFDYAFWYQGYSDAGRPASAYFNDAKSVIKYVTLNLKVQKWIIARGGGCPALTVGGVAAAQTSLGRQPIYGRFLGPDSADLTTSFSSGTCSLNKLGQNKMAELWAQSMREADRLNEIYQKESLLYYFKQH